MANRTGVVTASSLNLRPAASTSNTPLTSLPRGTIVQILDRQGGWYRVRAGGREGFVSADFVVLHAQEPAIGFLHEQAALQQVPLAPPYGRVVDLAAARTATEQSVARTWNRYGGLLQVLGEQIGIHPGAAVAVLCVESSGTGFVNDRLVIRFENHIFFNHWGIFNQPTFTSHFAFNLDRRWTDHVFRPDPQSPFESFHGNQAKEWRVFDFARVLSEPAALRSISMGLPQIMGFNSARIGYDSPREMFGRFGADVRFQILGMFDFIKGPRATSGMVQALERHHFEQFATAYNGAGKAAEYGAKIRNHVEAFQRLLPEV